MEPVLLSAKEAAQRLGVSVTTLYDWLGQSDRGLLTIHGQKVTIDYFQSGGQGQGRIQIEEGEVTRLHNTMRVRPKMIVPRRTPVRQSTYPGINVPLGHPGRRS